MNTANKNGILFGLLCPGVLRAKKADGAYLTFASEEPFSIGVKNAKKNWNGTLYYSTDTATWNEWDGTTAIASATHDGEQRIYMRGSGNTKISGFGDKNNVGWVLSGSNIRCEGNIENLLDYETVANGEHPSMVLSCYESLFYGCTNLITAPDLLATKLYNYCYCGMFEDCTGLTVAPRIAATSAGSGGNCCLYMFKGCKNLTTLPKLHITFFGSAASNQYNSMFYGCTKIKLSTTQSDEYPTPYRIPFEGEGTLSNNTAFKDMFTGTGGTFTGTPEINTTYYLHKDNAVV